MSTQNRTSSSEDEVTTPWLVASESEEEWEEEWDDASDDTAVAFRAEYTCPTSPSLHRSEVWSEEEVATQCFSDDHDDEESDESEDEAEQKNGLSDDAEVSLALFRAKGSTRFSRLLTSRDSRIGYDQGLKARLV